MIIFKEFVSFLENFLSLLTASTVLSFDVKLGQLLGIHRLYNAQVYVELHDYLTIGHLPPTPTPPPPPRNTSG